MDLGHDCESGTDAGAAPAHRARRRGCPPRHALQAGRRARPRARAPAARGRRARGDPPGRPRGSQSRAGRRRPWVSHVRPSAGSSSAVTPKWPRPWSAARPSSSAGASTVWPPASTSHPKRSDHDMTDDSHDHPHRHPLRASRRPRRAARGPLRSLRVLHARRRRPVKTVQDVEVLQNAPHTEGGCMAPGARARRAQRRRASWCRASAAARSWASIRSASPYTPASARTCARRWTPSSGGACRSSVSRAPASTDRPELARRGRRRVAPAALVSGLRRDHRRGDTGSRSPGACASTTSRPIPATISRTASRPST